MQRISFVISLSMVVFTLTFPASFECSVQQQWDRDFDASITTPAYAKHHPRVLFDEGHANYHTSKGRYKPFADLVTNDGYAVTASGADLSKQALEGYQILVVAGALGANSVQSIEWSQDWLQAGARPAFKDQECDAIRDWVAGGGGLLLISDHPPFGAAIETLAGRFRVETGKGYVFDRAIVDERGIYRNDLTFTRNEGGVADHPIMNGRNETERIHRVMTFLGQSLKGPTGAVTLLRLSGSAVEKQTPSVSAKEVPVGGLAQGIAMTHGKGRVVVLGEAAMLSAQTGGPGGAKFGMNAPGVGNRQLALNIMHWLSGLLN